MFLARIYVTPRSTVNDPQGLTIKGSLQELGFGSVEGVRMGKYLEVRLDAESEENAASQVNGMCDKLLANPVIEEYRFELERSE